jgi:hypothetical protein
MYVSQNKPVDGKRYANLKAEILATMPANLPLGEALELTETLFVKV